MHFVKAQAQVTQSAVRKTTANKNLFAGKTKRNGAEKDINLQSLRAGLKTPLAIPTGFVTLVSLRGMDFSMLRS